ncbi:MAG: hypothetical protein J6W09_03390, partial [Bacteroidales bacterium]|nr:hypothetical protein [Bacteroidales bacterium]
YSGPAEEGYYELYARFFNSVNSDVPNTSTVAVRVELEPMTDGSDDILILYDDNENRVPTRGFFFPEAATVGGVEGIRTIRFNTVEPLDVTKTQKIKITGHNPGNPQDLRLYREVEITLQNKQPLTVTCTDPVPLTTNTSIDVGINITKELPESMFPLEFIVEPEARTLTPDTGRDINMPVVSGKSIATTESAFKDTPAFYYLRTLTWDEFLSLDVNDDGQRTFHCYFKPNRDFNATTIWVYNEYFSKGWASYENKIPLTLTCTNPVVSVVETPVTLAVTIHSGLPESMFPMEFIVEPEDMTLTPDMSQNIDMPLSSGHFIRILDWNEYTNLPTDGKVRTFYCYFKTTVAESATTIRVSNDYCYNANVSFQNVEALPDNHFWVEAVDNCTVKLNYEDLQYKIDDGAWDPYNTPNSPISLIAGQKVSFKAGSKKSPKTWTVVGAFSSSGGRFRVGGNFASLMVGDDYPTEGEKRTSSTFIDFFKAQTGLIDAYDLVLPMKSLAKNAYKSMFDSCKNLWRGPQYLPATTLGETCYRNMFFNCTSLEYAPDLPATTLVSGAYQRMFYGCSKLNHIKMLGKNWKSDVFTSDGTKWCAGVASNGEIILNASIQNATNWQSTWGAICPAGWTVTYE